MRSRPHRLASLALAAPLLYLAAPTGAIAAPEPPPDVVQLTIEEALRRAEAHSPLVERARAAREVVGGRRVGAAVLMPANPWVSFIIGGATEPGTPTGLWNTLHVEQAIEIAGQRGTRKREVEAAVSVATARERFAQMETRARVRVAYLGAVIASRYLETAVQREDVMRRVVAAVRTRLQLGAANEVDLHLAEVELDRVSVDRRDAEIAGSEHRGELRLLVALPPTATLQLVSPIPQLGELPSLETLLDAALANRADLEALSLLSTQIDREIVRLRRESVPNPALFFEVQQQYPNQLYFGGGLSLQIPMWRWNQGDIAVARASRAASSVERAVAGREVEREVAQAYRAAEQRRAQMDIYVNSIIPAVERNVELIEIGWRAGKFDLYRVTVAMREAADARRTQLAIIGALWQSVIELDRATGRP